MLPRPWRACRDGADLNILEKLPSAPTRIIFFTGKGGVGKTSLSCATAVALADQGKKTLLVCTDPASNLNAVLGTPIGSTITPVRDIDNLSAINIDPEDAARRYRERVVGPYAGVLPEASVAAIEEQLSGACTTEIAAFDEFVSLLGDDEATGRHDHVIFDTAPTGHTLRLMKLPAAWSHFIDTSSTGSSCLGPLSGLQAQHVLYQEAMRRLADAFLTTLVLVSTPRHAALVEAERSSLELAGQDIKNQILVINGVFMISDPSDPIAVAMWEENSEALADMPAALRALPKTELPLQAEPLLGIAALRLFGGCQGDNQGEAPPKPADIDLLNDSLRMDGLETVVESLAARGKGVVMTMGKGGVGKTTLATALAVALSRRGFAVQLTTTDPAAHIDRTLAHTEENLKVSVIDPEAETRRYQAEVMAEQTGGLDEDGRKLLEEDLRSPCTEEIAVFQAFARKVDQAREGFVVMDTAPTGHTLLLLDATEAYHREVSRTKSDLPEAVTSLLPRLRDPGFTAVFIVTLPEATPVQEAAGLQDDLRRAGIEPAGWIINRSLVPLTVTDPLLSARRAAELPYINKVKRELAESVALTAWQKQSSRIIISNPAAAGP
ncbi:MAG: arsenical pump-driving ATPase [Thermoleophilia bacterium]